MRILIIAALLFFSNPVSISKEYYPPLSAARQTPCGIPAIRQEIPAIQRLLATRQQAEIIEIVPTRPQSLPMLKIDAAEFINIFSEFNVVRELNPSFCSKNYGLTDYGSSTITICGAMDPALRKKTILHEIVHIVYWQHGIDTSQAEDFVDSRAIELFLDLYGVK